MNEPLFLIVSLIIAVFVGSLIVQSVTKKTFCALCVSVSLSWAIFLAVALFTQWFDPKILAVFMGTSITGILYVVEKKIPPRLNIFKMPFFLSLALTAYALVGLVSAPVPLMLLMGSLWLITGFIYLFQTHPRLKHIATRLIECCKNF